ncbi:hypothetical protein R1flu_014597 [Riccia fluitans]|uniref:Glycine-rich protein n=1 Tax=Riccia fluitans TaxID=41844 RepID=A0ABD1YGJ7_9MARC
MTTMKATKLMIVKIVVVTTVTTIGVGGPGGKEVTTIEVGSLDETKDHGAKGEGGRREEVISEKDGNSGKLVCVVLALRVLLLWTVE